MDISKETISPNIICQFTKCKTHRIIHIFEDNNTLLKYELIFSCKRCGKRMPPCKELQEFLLNFDWNYYNKFGKLPNYDSLLPKGKLLEE